jgi:hypothetical protein
VCSFDALQPGSFETLRFPSPAGQTALMDTQPPDRFERYKQERRQERAEVFGPWAADDEAWERATGQRWPRVPDWGQDAEGG